MLGEFFRACWRSGQVCDPYGTLHAGSGGGVALHEAVVQRVAGVSDPRVVQFPHRVAVRSQLEVVRHPKCRPPRRKVLKMGSCGRGGLGFGHVASDMAHMRRCPGIE